MPLVMLLVRHAYGPRSIILIKCFPLNSNCYLIHDMIILKLVIILYTIVNTYHRNENAKVESRKDQEGQN